MDQENSMPLILELPAEAETRLKEQAQINNQTLTEYACEILLREARLRTKAPMTKAPMTKALKDRPAGRKRSRLSQMRGVGAEIWKDIGDAQQWINAQRDEWDNE
jgi:hypothetical protein